MHVLYRITADIVVVLHFVYAAFVVGGLLLTLIGIVRRWQWVRNVWFRAVHLLAIVIVVAESWLGIVCPLTTWEKALRDRAGQATYDGDFIASWVHELLFYRCEDEVWIMCYTAFGLAVLATFVFAPPRWRSRPRSEDECGNPRADTTETSSA